MKTDLVVAAFVFSDEKVLLIHHRKLGLWLPVGGHMEPNETPDEALKREIREETGLEVRLLNSPKMPDTGNVKKHLAKPFYVNVHPVKDHDHCCFFYVAEALNPQELEANRELLGARWFSKEDLEQDFVPEDVRNQAVMAFGLFERKNGDA